MRGTADERWLWPDTIRIMRELRPRYGVFENPPALLGLEQGRAWNGIVSGLVASGYDLWWDVFPAAAFGAGHLRERVILVAADPARITQRIEADQSNAESGSWDARRLTSSNGHCAAFANTNSQGLQGHPGNGANSHGRPGARRPASAPDLRGRVFGADWWHEAHAGVPVLATGLPSRLVEAVSRCVGNSVVPQAVVPVLEAIAQNMEETLNRQAAL